MGKMQAALKKAEEARSRGGASETSGAGAGATGAGTATAFAIATSLSASEIDPHLVVLCAPQSQIAEQ